MQTFSEPAERTMRRLSQLAEIGAEGHAGAFRAGLSDAEQRACQLVAGWLEQEGLTVALGRQRQPLRAAGRNRPGRGRDVVGLAPRHGAQRRPLRRRARRAGALEAVASLRPSPRRQRWPWSHSATRRAGGSARALRQPCVCATCPGPTSGELDADGVTVGEALAALG